MRMLPLVLTLLASAGTAIRADTRLKVGDAAPKLQVGKWIQGDGVTAFDKDKVYLVDFWATWCGPCRVSIPHLNEICQKFRTKGLVVIGQDCAERDESLVGPFIKKMADHLTYPVALDDKSSGDTGVMRATWMEAAGQSVIPTAFVIDRDGRIAWIGHPMALKDSVIEQILAGSYDIKRAASDYTERQERKAWLARLSFQLNRALQNRDWDAAEAVVKKIEVIVPEEEQVGLGASRVEILLGKGETNNAANLALKVSDAHKDDAALGNLLAWKIAIQHDPSSNMLEVASIIAARANAAAAGRDPSILVTLARVTFLQGHTNSAIHLQEKAVRLAQGDTREKIQIGLDSYRQGKLPSITDTPSDAFASTTRTPPPTPTANPGSSLDNRVLHLDGKTASMRVPDSSSLHSLTNAMTLEVWFNAESFSKQFFGVNSLLRKNVNAGGRDYFLRFRIINGNPVIEMRVGTQILSEPCGVKPGVWYHLAGTYDGQTMTVLVNGTPLRTEPCSNPLALDDSGLVIGSGDPNFSDGEYFQGELDDIRVWNVARSPEQIQATMNAHLTGKELGLVAYWTFDDTGAKDTSNHGNDGVLYGEARIGAAGARPDSSSAPSPARLPVETSNLPKPTQGQPWENSLKMKFVPVLGTKVLFSIWQTRVQDYSAFARTRAGGSALWEHAQFRGVPVSAGLDHPVTMVNWEDAQAFCQWLTETERTAERIGPSDLYRLPTDAEWSIAVGLLGEKGTTPKERDMRIRDVYSWGTGWPPPLGVGNFADESAKAILPDMRTISDYRDGFATTAPVGSFSANPLGLYDLGGNVGEWCDDLYEPSSEFRVVRGCSWHDFAPRLMPTSVRGRFKPGFRSPMFGFRCVLALTRSTEGQQ